MNRAAVRRALFFDALYQVLDNRVFRILTVFTAVMVAVPWLIGFREQELVIAWGWKRYQYSDILASLGPLVAGVEGSDQQRVVGALVDFLVSNIAGTFGLFFSLAATSFFVPRLLEKGAADPLFSKPLSRFSLLFSRYISGLLFVVLLTAVLLGGITAGLVVNSHYYDLSLLWSGVSLVYRFALLSSFATLVGVMTRSSTASLLLTFVFLGFCTLVHWGWVGLRWDEDNELSRMVNASRDLAPKNEDVQEVQSDMDVFVGFLEVSASVLHHALPKTIDADLIAKLLRTEFQAPTYTDEIFIETRPRPQEEDPKRTFRSRPGRLALRQDGFLEYTRGENLELVPFDQDGMATLSVYGGDIEVRKDASGHLQATREGEPVELLERPQKQQGLFEQSSPPDWYASKLRWDAPWRFNPWYSITSSVAFAMGMLGLAWARLRRINF